VIWTTRLSNPKSMDRIVVPAGFNRVAYWPKFVLSADTKNYRSIPSKKRLSPVQSFRPLKQLEPLERLELSYVVSIRPA